MAIVLGHGSSLGLDIQRHYPFSGGYLAVELFFSLTGYFAVKKALETPEVSPADGLGWTWRKFARIFPYVVPAVIVQYLAIAQISGYTLQDTVRSLVYGIFEMSLLTEAGFQEVLHMEHLWYLSAMMILLPIFYGLCIRMKRSFIALICPLSAWAVYGFFSTTVGNMNTWAIWLGHIYSSLPRAWAGLCLGGVIYLLSEKIGALKFSRAGEIFLTVVEGICSVLVAVYMYLRGFCRLDYLVISLWIVAASIALSEKALIRRCFPTWVSRLADFSLALYVSHWTVRMLIPLCLPSAPYAERLITYISLTAAYSACLNLVIIWIKRLHPGRKIKNLILQKEVYS